MQSKIPHERQLDPENLLHLDEREKEIATAIRDVVEILREKAAEHDPDWLEGDDSWDADAWATKPWDEVLLYSIDTVSMACNLAHATFPDLANCLYSLPSNTQAKSWFCRLVGVSLEIEKIKQEYGLTIDSPMTAAIVQAKVFTDHGKMMWEAKQAKQVEQGEDRIKGEVLNWLAKHAEKYKGKQEFLDAMRDKYGKSEKTFIRWLAQGVTDANWPAHWKRRKKTGQN